jgi:hypothetical protein
MPKYLIILSLIIPSVSFAGGHGGGVMMTVGPAKQIDSLGAPQPKEIVFHLGQHDGLIKFAYGHLVNNDWQVQKLEIPEADLLDDSSVMKAIQNSKSLKDWAEIR